MDTAWYCNAARACDVTLCLYDKGGLRLDERVETGAVSSTIIIPASLDGVASVLRVAGPAF